MQAWLNQRPGRVMQVLRIVIVFNLCAAAIAAAAPRDDDAKVTTADRAAAQARSTGDTPASEAESQAAGLDPSQPGTASSVASTVAGTARTTLPALRGPTTTAAPAPARIPVAPGTHGVTDTTIEIGIIDTDTGSGMTAINGASGANNSASASPTGGASIKSVVSAIVKNINANGGLAGRNIVPVYAPVDVTSYFTPAQRQQEQQKACATWTEDHHVFAFSAIAMSEELVFECAVRSKTPMVAIGYQAYLDQARFDKMADYWYAPHGLLAERRERAMAKELLAQGFFGRGARVAIMTEDKPSIRVGVDLGMKPVLRAAGVDVTEIVYPDPVASPWNNYALQLMSANVTHIIMSATSFSMFPTLFMMRAVDSQQYRPRWAIASDNEPAALAQYQAPQSQMQNTQGMGWRVVRDTGDTAPVSPTDIACRDIMKRASLPETAGATFCENFFFLKAGFDRMSVISPAAFSQAVNGLGKSYVGYLNIGGATSFNAAKHDGPTVVSALAYDNRCTSSGVTCFKYVGAPHPMPE